MEGIKPFSEFSLLDRRKVLDWICYYLNPRKTVNYKHTGYGIKQGLTSETGVYVRTEQFQQAMTEAGFNSVLRPGRYDGTDYYYNIAENSPAFRCISPYDREKRRQYYSEMR